MSMNKNDEEKISRQRGLCFEEALSIGEKTGERIVPTFCAMCGPTAGCGIYAFIKDGIFTRAAGMKESPVNRGALCPKGQAAPQWLYSSQRLRTPLKRTGKKGEGKFAEITWDEAIGIIAEKLKEQKMLYGPESLAILSPARRTYSDFIQRFLISHGSPNYGHSGICAMQRAFSYAYTIGASPACDYKNTELIILWGRQPIYSGPAMTIAKDFIAAKQRGAKIIAVKPSVEPDVGMSDIWMPLRPGTDAALALSMLHVIINEKLYDEEFVKKWCYGFTELKEHVQKYTPSWGENICGVPKGKIIEVARLYADTPKALIDMGNGVEHMPAANDAIRAVAIMMAITGHLDHEGSNIFGGGPPGAVPGIPRPKSVNMPERYTPEMVSKLVGPEFPPAFQPFLEGTSSAYFRIIESVLTEKPYPIRTIISPGTQPSLSTRGTRNVIKALKKLDFYVVIDVTRTADIDYADIVLPTASMYETNHPFEARGNLLMARNAVVEPLGDYKSTYEFFLDLGKVMGYGDDFWNGDMDACQNFMLEPYGMSISELRKLPIGRHFEIPDVKPAYEKYEKVFASKSTSFGNPPYLPQGKVALYNTTFEKEGFNPLPEWREPPESITGTPELTSKYPLVLSDYHTAKMFTASWQRNVPILREMQPHPLLHIHPETAAERQIENGEWVKVESPHGWIKVKAEYYPGIRPDTVMMLHGSWQGCPELGLKENTVLDGGANVNLLYSVDPEKAYDPLITAMSSQTLVEVSRYE